MSEQQSKAGEAHFKIPPSAMNKCSTRLAIHDMNRQLATGIARLQLLSKVGDCYPHFTLSKMRQKGCVALGYANNGRYEGQKWVYNEKDKKCNVFLCKSITILFRFRQMLSFLHE